MCLDGCKFVLSNYQQYNNVKRSMVFESFCQFCWGQFWRTVAVELVAVVSKADMSFDLQVVDGL